MYLQTDQQGAADAPRTREPPTYRLVRLAQVSRRSKRVLGPLTGVLLDG